MNPRSKRYYSFKGINPHNTCITELPGMHSIENVSGSDVAFTSSEMKEVEAASRALLEAGLWMDCWLMAAHSMVTHNSPDEKSATVSL